MDRAMRRVSWNLASCDATVQKLLVRQVLNKSKLWSWSVTVGRCVINMCNKHVHSTMTRSSRFHCPIGVMNKPTTDEFRISLVYWRRCLLVGVQISLVSQVHRKWRRRRNHRRLWRGSRRLTTEAARSPTTCWNTAPTEPSGASDRPEFIIIYYVLSLICSFSLLFYVFTFLLRVLIRYDTIRDVILTCARKPTRVSLIYRTETTTKKCITEKKLKSKNG